MNKYSEIQYLSKDKFGDVEGDILTNSWKCAADGSYKRYKFAIMYNGVNPCAYVMIPKSNPFYNIMCKLIKIEEKNGIGEVMNTPEYYEINKVCNCHGGITWMGYYQNYEHGVWLGWDYMHSPYDYNGYFQSGNTKWTVDKIYSEIKSVINNLIVYSDQVGNKVY